MFRVLYELTAAQRSRYSDSSSCGAEKTAAETEEGTCLRSQSPTPCGPHGLEAGRRDSTLRALMKDTVLAELRGGPAWGLGQPGCLDDSPLPLLVPYHLPGAFAFAAKRQVGNLAGPLMSSGGTR